MGKALDALGLARSEREVRKWEKCSCPERENGISPPQSLPLWLERLWEVKRDYMRVWVEFQLMGIKGTGQNMNYKILPEGV